jgi:hypothetical protein
MMSTEPSPRSGNIFLIMPYYSPKPQKKKYKTISQ